MLDLANAAFNFGTAVLLAYASRVLKRIKAEVVHAREEIERKDTLKSN